MIVREFGREVLTQIDGMEAFVARFGEKKRMHPPKTAGVFSLILSSGWLGAERSACDLAYAA